MSKKLHLDMAAEKEATDIGKKFMNSTDVVGDMGRAYGTDLSSVRIHTDGGAAQRAAQRGVDAFSTGKDVFFGRGAFNQNDPASRGLLAHELSHSLQQGVGGASAMEHSAPMGAEQGGLLSWFRGLFGGKKKVDPEIENMVISEPALVHSTNDRYMEDGPYTDADAVNDLGDKSPRDFMNYRSYVLNQMVQGASREQLQDPALRRLVQEDYNANMNQRLRSVPKGAEKRAVDEHFRGRSGELHTLNMVLGGFVPEDYSGQVMQAFGDAKGTNATRTEAAMKYMADTLGGNEELMEYMGGLGPSFNEVEHYKDDPDAQSDKMMNNLVLRIVNGEVGKKYGLAQRDAAAQAKARGITDPKAIAAEQAKVDKTDLVRAQHIQKAMNSEGFANGSFHANRLRGLLSRRYRK